LRHEEWEVSSREEMSSQWRGGQIRRSLVYLEPDPERVDDVASQ
jgi:hypothetical protein